MPIPCRSSFPPHPRWLLGLAFGICAAALPAQGPVLDVLDGETLYDGGSLLTLGHEWQRRDTLRRGAQRIDDPAHAHELEASTTLAYQYGLRNDLQLGVAVTFRATEAVATGTSTETSGLGDLEFIAKYRFLRLDARGVATNFALLAGVSLPTGEDDHRAGATELPPDLQLGSGGIDPMLGIAATHEPGRWRFNAALLEQVHTDTDGDGDRRGNALVAELAAGNRFWLEPYPGPFMRLDVVGRWYREGRDRQDGPLADTGGERLTLGLNYAFRPRPALDLQVYFEAPVAQHVRGTQLAEDWTLDVTIGYRF